MTDIRGGGDPLHRDEPTLRQGAEIARASLAMILVHGRGATADGMLALTTELERPDMAFLAPQAARNTWYPYSFLSPIDRNEPWLSSALQRLEDLVQQLQRQGVPADRTVLFGFSQGACLTTEFVARHPRRYAAVVGLTGGLIGPEVEPGQYSGRLEGTPVFLGSSDPDPHVPWARVQETAGILQGMGAQVRSKRYPGMPHTICADELDEVRALLATVPMLP